MNKEKLKNAGKKVMGFCKEHEKDIRDVAFFSLGCIATKKVMMFKTGASLGLMFENNPELKVQYDKTMSNLNNKYSKK